MMRSRSIRWIASIAAVVLLLPGCGDTDDAGGTDDAEAEVLATPSPSTLLAQSTSFLVWFLSAWIVNGPCEECVFCLSCKRGVRRHYWVTHRAGWQCSSR